MPRLLLLTETRLVQDLNESFVRRSGFTLILVRDGATLLDAAATGETDLIISGIDGPDTDGIELCRTLKSSPRTAGIPVLLYGPHELQVRARAAGAVTYLPEPWTQSQLLGAIRMVFPAVPRSAGRSPISLMVRCGIGGKSYIAFTKDISTTGVFLKGVSLATPGAKLSLRMEVPQLNSSARFELDAEVVRVSESTSDGRSVPGVGVRFLDLPIERRLTLARLLTERAVD